MANLVKEGSFANDSLADIYIANVDSQLNAGNPVTDTGMYNAWGNQILNISAAIAALQQTADSLISAFDSVRYQKVALAANDNAAIIPGNDIETYYQAANDIYLNTIAIDSNVFDSTQLAELYELAFLCPLKGGQAVFKARSMLALVTDTFYNDDSVCACIMHDDDKRLNISRPDSTYITDTNAITVKMYPNPARNYVVLALSQAINGPVLLKVADALGSIILNTNISLQAGIYTINTASFSSGVYYVTLYTGQNEIFNGKLVIFEK